MEELIQEVSKRTGLPADTARVAAEAVINFLKGKLPEPAAGMLSQFASGAEPGAEQKPDLVGQATAAVGGLFKRS